MARDMLDTAQMVLHGEQIANASRVDNNSLGMRDEYNDAFHRSSYFSQMNHKELSIKLLIFYDSKAILSLSINIVARSSLITLIDN